MYRIIFSLFLSRLDPETAHHLALSVIRLLPVTGLGTVLRLFTRPDPALAVAALGTRFDSPFGVAAGFDKDGVAVRGLGQLGFGHVEVGTVTAEPQSGNARPRLFRLIADQAVVNRMGFPGKGLDVFEKNFRAFKNKYPARIVGANIGINKDAKDALAAYKTGFERLAPVADYITVNVSSPNTAGLRNLQAREELDKLLTGLMALKSKTPLLLKIAPDLDTPQRADIAALALKHRIGGLIISNTTVTRPSRLAAALQNEKGGLSGRLLKDMSTDVIRDFYRLTSGNIPIIGAGGVASAEDAYEKIRAGASLVQVYTALVFQGPALVAGILEGLAGLLARDGLQNISAAVGLDAGQIPVKAVG